MSGKVKLVKTLAKQLKKRLKNSNSTDNMSNSGPIDNAINRGVYNRELRTYHGSKGSQGDKISNNLLERPQAGSKGTLGPGKKGYRNENNDYYLKNHLKVVTKKDGRRVVEDRKKNIY